MPLLDWLGLGGGTAAAQPSLGLLDPRAIRQQALFQALTATGAGLLAAGERRPATAPSLLPQAVGAFPQAYQQGMQSGMLGAQIDQQAQDQARMEELRRSNPLYANLPTAALVAQASRAQARPMADADSVRIFGTTGGVYDQNNVPRLPEGPRTAGLTEIERSNARIYPWTAGGGLATGAAIRGGGVPGVPPLAGGAPPAAVPGGGMPQPGAVPGSPPPGALSRPGISPGDPRRGERPWEAADFAFLNLPTGEAQQRADSMNRIQPGITAPAPGMQPQGAAPPAGGGAPAPSQGQAGLVRIAPGVMADTRPAPGTLEGRGDAEYGQRTQTRLDTLATRTEANMQVVSGIRELRGMLDQGLQTGTGADARIAIANFFRTAGVAPELANSIMSADAQAYRAVAGNIVLGILGGHLGAQISDSDRRMIERLVPQLYDNPESARTLMDVIDRRYNQNIENSVRQYRGGIPRNADADRDPFLVGHAIFREQHPVQRPAASGPAQPVARPTTPPPPPPPTSSPVTIGGQRGVESAVPPRPGAPLPSAAAISMMSRNDLATLAGRAGELNAEQQQALDRRLRALGF